MSRRKKSVLRCGLTMFATVALTCGVVGCEADGSVDAVAPGAMAETATSADTANAGSEGTEATTTASESDDEIAVVGAATSGDAATATLEEIAPAADGSGTPSDISCQALTIISQRCGKCHGAEPQYGAPMALASFDDFQAMSRLVPGDKLFERVAVRIHDERYPMPPPPESITEEELAVIDAFVSAGAPAAECELPSEPDGDTGEAEDDFVWPADCEERYTFVASAEDDRDAPHEVHPDTETHPQFVFDAPWGDDEVHIIARRPITDNPKVIHHWILWARGDTDATSKSLSGWAPGQQENSEWVPMDVGMEAPSGKGALLLDLHYYNLGGDKVELDRSGVEICITRTLREHTANIVGLFASADVAPNARAENALECTVNLTSGDEAHLLAVTPHMHKLGVHGKLELMRNGEVNVLHDMPFSFTEQRNYSLGDVVLQQGDVLRTTCTFENTTSNMITFGEGSNDEMCINWVMTYPAGALDCAVGR